MGIGAFNLVCRKAYEESGGHEAIRLCVDDDVKIAEALKDAGCRIAICHANGMVKVRWQKGMWELIKGMEKNAFASFLFRVDFVCAVVLGLIVVDVLPYLLFILWENPVARAISALEILLAIAVYRRLGKFFATPPGAGLIHPLLIVLLIYTICISTIVTLKNGGVKWRGTFYDLKALRDFKPPLKRSL